MPLFDLEVRFGVVGQPGEDLADDFLPLALQHGVVQFVDRWSQRGRLGARLRGCAGCLAYASRR
jgi:hypothetical protein